LGDWGIDSLYNAKKESAAAAIMSDMNGKVMRSHLRLPIVSILLIAGRAKTKLRKPVTQLEHTFCSKGDRARGSPNPMLKYIAVFLLLEKMLKNVPELVRIIV
jgi:hypothetical protein